MKYVLIALSLITLAFASIGCSDGVCSGDNCTCEDGQDCEFECPDGNCSQNCNNGSSCNVTCEGGNCSQQCATGADTCEFSCSGGNCSQQCQASNCNSSCSGDNCTTNTGSLGTGGVNNIPGL